MDWSRISILASYPWCIEGFAFYSFKIVGLLLQAHVLVGAPVEESSVRDSRIPLVRYDGMDSRSDMSDLLSILAKCDEYESSISCRKGDSPPTLSPPSLSSDYSQEDEFGMVDTLYCQCNNVVALVEYLSCRSLFELDSFCPGC
jgi:hypothetical protein